MLVVWWCLYCARNVARYLQVVYLMNQRKLVDRVMKVLEEVTMRPTKLGDQQAHGHCAFHAKFQVSSFNRTGDMKDLKVACQHIPSQLLFPGALISIII